MNLTSLNFCLNFRLNLSLNLFAVLSLLLVSGMTLLATAAQAQTALPAVSLKDIGGNVVSSADFENDGKPIVISFWATWCKPCLKELMTIHEEYADWQEETGVKLIAISIDDSRNVNKVAPLVNGKAWDYEVYLDENSDFKRAMNVTNVPHTFLLDANRNVIWQHTGYIPGDEAKLLEQIRALVAKK